MAGMEQLEIHSKSYLIRWVDVAPGHSISWSIKPDKKSINFGIFRHPRSNSFTPSLLSASSQNQSSAPSLDLNNSKRASSSRNDASTAPEKLQSIGLTLIRWLGKCEADLVSTGHYDVLADQGGMYALVFDNTFSKQISKTATVVLLTYPTHAPPQARHHQHHLQALSTDGAGSASIRSKASPRLNAQAVDSTESLSQPGLRNGSPAPTQRGVATIDTKEHNQSAATFYTGVLQKRRRKRHQGYARRFFSLDFTSSTLSYYHDNHSSALRGSIPLSLAAIAANEKTREISVDSGAEVWHLRCSNIHDFNNWKLVLEKASNETGDHELTPVLKSAQSTGHDTGSASAAESRERIQLESLLGRISGTRDAVRRLTHDTARGEASYPSGLGIKTPGENPSPVDSTCGDYFREKERRPFWKRTASSGNTTPSVFHRNSTAPVSNRSPSPNPSGRMSSLPRDGGMHKHCAALLNDLDSVVADFSALLSEHRRRRVHAPHSALSRHSIESTSTGEFYDADDGEHGSQLLVMYDSDNEQSKDEYSTDGMESASDSDDEGPDSFQRKDTSESDRFFMFPRKPKSLAPLPLEAVRRRTTIPAATMLPPSLIAFFRKNVGKDLSTISMPVSANEPTSFLQRISEQLEYCSLLTAAAKASSAGAEQLLLVTAFAISSFSNGRVKDRAIRKPFNPMLGETFELVREDLNMRYIAEKVTHRPVRMACQADSPDWTFSQSPMPTQKFWGKSAELNTEGRARVVLHAGRECFSWTTATSFLRNVIAGEKYVEPVGTMTVFNETTGAKAVVTFKSKGMFSGRSEDVEAQAFGPHGEQLSMGLAGKWTTSLALTDGGRDVRCVWSVGELVDAAPAHYGLTTFAASLNEITDIERGRLPITDSRLRPDQRAAEQGDLESAEVTKKQLEERQRQRRVEAETQGQPTSPRWFVKLDNTAGEDAWGLKVGRDGYWECRERKEWKDIVDIFAV
ncbi:MAG: hypothetical protein M1825_002428 [Sarcosagium campestre]|nr:MAG: hypothetical protein M1825_002428 [Sarcosagium campestre]